MRGRTGRAVMAGTLAALLLTGGVAACAPTSDLSETAADQLRQDVADVVAAAEDGRYEEALAAAAAVRTELERAADAGDLSVERYRLIEEALTRTEDELAAALAAAAAATGPELAEDGPASPEPQPEGEAPVTPDAEGEGPVTPDPEETRQGGDDGPGNNGRGNGRGNGGDKGRGND